VATPAHLTMKGSSVATPALITVEEPAIAMIARPLEELYVAVPSPLTHTQCYASREDNMQGCPSSEDSVTPDEIHYHFVSTNTPETKSLVYTKQQVSTSPANSPHKLGKIGPKRRWTMQVTNTPIQVERQPHSIAKQHSSKPSPVTFEDFQEGYNERERRQYLASMTFSYMVQKHAVQNSDTYKGQILKEFRGFATISK